MTGEVTGTRGLTIAIASYLLLVALELAAYYFTGILVLFAQALEKTSDVIISAFLLLTSSRSRKPADEIHMFGHGRAENVAALVSATFLIFFMSLETFRETIPRLFDTSYIGEIKDTNLALMVIAVSMVVIAIPLVDIFRSKASGASMRVQLVGLLKDELSFAVSLAGVILVANGYYWADPFASLIVAAIIAVSGLYLLKDNVHYLIGKAPSREFTARIESTAKSVKGVLGIHDLRAEYVGPNAVHAGFHIEVVKGTLIEEADRIAEEVRERVSRETGCQYCVIHVDPATGSTKGE